METEQIAQLILAAIQLSASALQAAQEMKKQSGMTDEQLLAFAEEKDADTRGKAEAFLDRLKGDAQREG